MQRVFNVRTRSSKCNNGVAFSADEIHNANRMIRAIVILAYKIQEKVTIKAVKRIKRVLLTVSLFRVPQFYIKSQLN